MAPVSAVSRQVRRDEWSPSGARIPLEGGEEDSGVSRLVHRSQHGDGLAFAELYGQFFDRVTGYLTVALGNPDDAQEVAQDVFVRALSSLDRYDTGRGQFCDWLFSMVRSLAIDHLRKNHSTSVEPNAMPGPRTTAAPQASSLLERLDPDAGVRGLIDALPRSQRRVLALRFVFELSTVQIAASLGLTSATVRQQQHRALETLRANGAGRCGRATSNDDATAT